MLESYYVSTSVSQVRPHSVHETPGFDRSGWTVPLHVHPSNYYVRSSRSHDTDVVDKNPTRFQRPEGRTTPPLSTTIHPNSRRRRVRGPSRETNRPPGTTSTHREQPPESKWVTKGCNPSEGVETTRTHSSTDRSEEKQETPRTMKGLLRVTLENLLGELLNHKWTVKQTRALSPYVMDEDQSV